MRGIPAKQSEFQKSLAAMSAQADTADAVLYQGARSGGAYIEDDNERIESMRAKSRGTILENVSDQVLIAAAGQVEKYVRTYDEKPDEGLFAAVTQGVENLVDEYGIGPGGKMEDGKILESVGSEQAGGNLTTSDGNMLLQHALMMVTTVPLEAITSRLITTVPGHKDEEVIFRLHNVVAKDAGTMKTGDVIDATFNGTLGHSRQRYPFPTVTDGTSATYTFTPADDAPLGQAVVTQPGQTAIYIDGAMVASDMTGSLTGEIIIGGTTHTLSGTVNNSTGVVVLNSSPVLPSGKQPYCKYCLDYEKAPEQIAQITQKLEKFIITPEWMALQSDMTIQAILGFKREHGKDLNAINIAAMRNTQAAELDRLRLNDMRFCARHHDTFDMSVPGSDSNNQHLSNRAHYETMFEVLTRMDRNIMQATHVAGMKGMVCGSIAAEILPFLPNWKPARHQAQRSAQPVYLGRLGPWDCFEDPNADQGEILCAGKGRNYGQSGYLSGVAIPPMSIKHSMTPNLKQTDTQISLNYDTVHPDGGEQYFGLIQVS